jgi:FAD/FMN-containing dehydrogenase
MGGISMTAVDETDDLARTLPGRVLRPDDAGYPEVVGAFNLAITPNPSLVVTATCAQDVVAAVHYAAAAGLPVAVQATGHGAYTGTDGALLISTRLMSDVRVDPAEGTATVGAGAKWRAVLDEAAVHGLGGLCGSASDVGVVGYTVGGGLPVLGRAFGFAADRVRSFEVVTGDGQLRTVDATSDPELFWALRGGKGNVGIVTSMTFDLVPVADVYAGGLFFAGEHAEAVLSAYAAWIQTVPEQMCSSLGFLRLPPFPEVPEPLRGQFVMHLRAAYVGDDETGEQLLAPMRACAPVLIDGVGRLDYAKLDLVHQDPDHPVPYAETGCLLDDLSPGALAALLELAGPDANCPLLLVELRHLGGALSRPAAAPDAIGARGAGFSAFGVGVLAGPAAAAVPVGLAALQASLAPYASGRTLLNLHGAPGDETDRARAWTPEQYERLQRAKAVYDPANLFRLGHAVSVPA